MRGSALIGVLGTVSNLGFALGQAYAGGGSPGSPGSPGGSGNPNPISSTVTDPGHNSPSGSGNTAGPGFPDGYGGTNPLPTRTITVSLPSGGPGGAGGSITSISPSLITVTVSGGAPSGLSGLPGGSGIPGPFSPTTATRSEGSIGSGDGYGGSHPVPISTDNPSAGGSSNSDSVPTATTSRSRVPPSGSGGDNGSGNSVLPSAVTIWPPGDTGGLGGPGGQGSLSPITGTSPGGSGGYGEPIPTPLITISAPSGGSGGSALPSAITIFPPDSSSGGDGPGGQGSVPSSNTKTTVIPPKGPTGSTGGDRTCPIPQLSTVFITVTPVVPPHTVTQTVTVPGPGGQGSQPGTLTTRLSSSSSFFAWSPSRTITVPCLTSTSPGSTAAAPFTTDFATVTVPPFGSASATLVTLTIISPLSAGPGGQGTAPSNAQGTTVVTANPFPSGDQGGSLSNGQGEPTVTVFPPGPFGVSSAPPIASTETVNVPGGGSVGTHPTPTTTITIHPGRPSGSGDCATLTLTMPSSTVTVTIPRGPVGGSTRPVGQESDSTVTVTAPKSSPPRGTTSYDNPSTAGGGYGGTLSHTTSVITAAPSGSVGQGGENSDLNTSTLTLTALSSTLTITIPRGTTTVPDGAGGPSAQEPQATVTVTKPKASSPGDGPDGQTIEPTFTITIPKTSTGASKSDNGQGTSSCLENSSASQAFPSGTTAGVMTTATEKTVSGTNSGNPGVSTVTVVIPTSQSGGLGSGPGGQGVSTITESNLGGGYGWSDSAIPPTGSAIGPGGQGGPTGWDTITRASTIGGSPSGTDSSPSKSWTPIVTSVVGGDTSSTSCSDHSMTHAPVTKSTSCTEPSSIHSSGAAPISIPNSGWNTTISTSQGPLGTGTAALSLSVTVGSSLGLNVTGTAAPEISPNFSQVLSTDLPLSASVVSGISVSASLPISSLLVSPPVSTPPSGTVPSQPLPSDSIPVSSLASVISSVKGAPSTVSAPSSAPLSPSPLVSLQPLSSSSPLEATACSLMSTTVISSQTISWCLAPGSSSTLALTTPLPAHQGQARSPMLLTEQAPGYGDGIKGGEKTILPAEIQTSFPSSSVPSTFSTVVGGKSDASSVATTGTYAPVPGACGSTADRGEFTFTLDDLPPLVVSPGTNQSDIHPMPMFSPYHRFWFSEGFEVVPPPKDPFLPSSGKLMLQFNPPTMPKVHVTGVRGDSARISVGPQETSDCFHFNFNGFSLGCDSTTSDCVFTFKGYRFDSSSQEEHEVHAETVDVPACPPMENCKLKPVAVTGFNDLTSVLIELKVDDNNDKSWWGDNLNLKWSDDSCAKAVCRSKVRDTIRKRDWIAAGKKATWSLWGFDLI